VTDDRSTSSGTRRTLGRDLLAAGAISAVLTALGLPFALLWQQITPRVEVVTTERGWAAVELYSDAYVLADLVFAGLGVAAGTLAAVVVWKLLRHRRGPVMLLGLVVGSVGCQVVAWRIGTLEWEAFWETVQASGPGWHLWRPPYVRFVELDPGAAWRSVLDGDVAAALSSLQLGALAVMALAAVFTYTVCAGWSRLPNLR
jgi:hypothetical protein